MKLIDTNLLTYTGSIDDGELQRRLLREALEQAGWIDEAGKTVKGVTTKISRYGGKAGTGGYSVTITRDLRQSDQPRLAKPEEGA